MTADRQPRGESRLADRVVLQGTVDFTMMYAAHDAFCRDLDRFVASSASGRPWTPVDHDRWATFTTQLHIHHRAEDDALWPPLRERPLDAAGVATLDEMEREHARIDPLLEQVGAAVQAEDLSLAHAGMCALRDELAAHVRHEENAALPLVETHLGPPGWTAFTATFRETQGIRGAATYFPWLLEDAPDEVRSKVLGVLPPPARLLYRLVWAPSYRRNHR